MDIQDGNNEGIVFFFFFLTNTNDQVEFLFYSR